MRFQIGFTSVLLLFLAFAQVCSSAPPPLAIRQIVIDLYKDYLVNKPRSENDKFARRMFEFLGRQYLIRTDRSAGTVELMYASDANIHQANERSLLWLKPYEKPYRRPPKQMVLQFIDGSEWARRTNRGILSGNPDIMKKALKAQKNFEKHGVPDPKAFKAEAKAFEELLKDFHEE
jgi:hypothetical protein